MGAWKQLRLLLWKDFLVRRRNLGVLGLTVGWAVGVFLVLYIVRESIIPEKIPSCQFKARTLPSAGLFPFLQSFVCNIDNKCENVSSYEEVPQYKNAKLTNVLHKLQDAFTDEDVLDIARNIPKMLSLVKTLSAGIESTHLEGLFGRGVPVFELLYDPPQVKSLLREASPDLDENVVDDLFNASFKFGPVVDSVGTTNFSASVCNATQLKRYLLVKNETSLERISSGLCKMNTSAIPKLIENLLARADFDKFMKKLEEIVNHFTTYNVYEDLAKLVDMVLHLESVQQYLPKEVRLPEWLPEVLPLLNTMNKSRIDKQFVIRVLNIIEPYFNETYNWPAIRRTILTDVDTFIILQEHIVHGNASNVHIGNFTNSIIYNFYATVEDLNRQSNRTDLQLKLAENTPIVIQYIFNQTFSIFNNFDINSYETVTKITNMFDVSAALHHPFQALYYFILLHIYNKSLSSIYYEMRNHLDVEETTYNVCKQHNETLAPIVDLGPEFVNNLFTCFANISCMNVLIRNKENISDFFCNEESLNEIRDFNLTSVNTSVLCVANLTNFVDDLSNELYLKYSLNKIKLGVSNMSVVVNSTKHFLKYIEEKIQADTDPYYDWSALFPSTAQSEWSNVTSRIQSQRNLYIINAQLAYFRYYYKINNPNGSEWPNIKYMTSNMKAFLQEYKLIPNLLLQQTIANFPVIVETALKTLTNKSQILKLSQTNDWVKYLCGEAKEERDALKQLGCDIMSHLLGQQRTFPPLVPILQAISTGPMLEMVSEKDLQDFEVTAQEFLLTLYEISSYKLPVYNWSEMEVLKQNYWVNWFKKLDVESEIRFGIRIVANFVDLIDRYSTNMTKDIKTAKAISANLNQYIIFVNDLIDMAINANKTNLQSYYPLTFNVSRTIATNLSFLVQDFNSYMDKDLSNVSRLTRLFDMPCNEDALQVFKDFRSETKSVIAALRDVVCNTTKYVNEWQFDYQLKQNVVEYDAAKDWQHAVDKFGAVVRQIRNNGYDREPVQHWSKVTKELELVHQGYEFERLLFAMVDTQLNTPESGYKSMVALWKSYNKQCTWNNTTRVCTSLRTDVAKYMAKVVAAAIGETVTRVRSYLRTINSTEGVSPLALLGFSNSSAVHMMYTKLPDIINMFVNSYRRPEFELQILNKVTQGQSATCTDVMSWLSVPTNSSLSTSDMRSITRYLCPSIFDWPLIEDNYLLSIALTLEKLATSTPVAKLDKTYVSVLNDILLLKDDLLSVSQYGQVNLTVLWTKPWLDDMRHTFRQLQQLEFSAETSITRLFAYVHQPEAHLWLYPKQFLTAKYGFGEFSLVLRLMTRFLEKLSDADWTDTDLNTREQAQALLDLFEFYPKQVSGILAFVYFRTSHGSDFWYTLQATFCEHGHVSQTMKTYIPSWMLQDEDEILTRLCKLNSTQFDNLYYDPDFKNVTQFNVPFENIVIDFISSILNITDDRNFTLKTIILSDILSDNFLNEVLPSEDQSRNSSIVKAEAIVEKLSVYGVMTFVEQLQMITTYIKMLEGGDWWKSLMTGTVKTPMQTLLHIIEKIPLYPLQALQTATVPNLPYRIASEVLRNPRFPCRSTLDLSDFLDENNLLLLIQEMCRAPDHIPDIIVEEYILNENETEYSWSINETVLAENIFMYERELVKLLRDGIQRPTLPYWLNGTLIADKYRSFGKRMQQPLILLQTVTAAMTDVLDIASLFYKNETKCRWCPGTTLLIQIINQQLVLTPNYIDLMCRMPNMTYDQIKHTLLTDFRWEHVLKKLKENYSLYTIDDFNEEIHSSVDVIRSQIIAFYTNKTLQTLPAVCLHNLTHSPAARNLSTYVSIASELVRGAKLITLNYLNTSTLEYIANKVEGNITSIIPTRYLIDENILVFTLKHYGFNQYEINQYLNSSLNVTKLSEVKNENELNNLLSSPETSLSVITYYAGASKNYRELANVIYYTKTQQHFKDKVLEWRRNQKGPLDKVIKIFDSMENVFLKSDNLFEFLGKIDFNAITNGTFNPSSVLEGVADLLRNKSLEKLFDSFRDLIKQLSYVIHNKQVEQELYTVVDGVEGLNIFRNLRLLTLKYNISDLTNSWTNASDFLTKELQLKPDVIQALLNSSLDMLEIFASQKGLTNIRTYLCNSNELQTLFHFNNESPDETAITVSEALCNLNTKQLQELAVLLLKNLNFSNLLTQVMNSTTQNVLSNANLSEVEGRNVMNSLGKATSYLPTLRSVATTISDDLTTVPNFQKLQAQNFTKSLAVSPDVMSSATTLLCGRPLIQRHAKIYKTIAEAKDFSSNNYNEAEEMSLPTEFCRNTYRNILQLNAGKVIWSYMKPLIRGKILFTPDIPLTRQIMESTNFTFSRIGDFQDVLLQTITQMEDVDLGSSLNKIQEFMKSFIVQAAIERVMQESNITFDLSKMNVTKLLNEFGDGEKLKNSLNLSKDILQCVLLNRFVPMEDETALEHEAKKLMEHNEFIAGVVFVDLPTRSKRDTQLPHNITYKIRMDIDSVPTTSATRYQFWTPGPDADFLDDMRYFRGFIQLQDMLDNAIIEMHANRQDIELPQWQTLTQQMPYPCWTKDFFKTALSVAQGLQVCFFFGFIVLVAASVRYVVWEKESGNTMVMNVMGLKYLTHCASWFIVTFVEMVIVTMCAFAILIFGNILPTTSPSLLLLYMLDYGFSVVMFCYMVSSMFDSASLGSVGSAIFYLLSFMPYIIIISLETTLSLWFELFVNLSMSTSFCYGCLYIIRYETQGVGLSWSNAWSTPLPGDSINFGMTCVFIAFDGILYGIIGYICSRSSQELRVLLKRLPIGCFFNRYQLLNEEATYVTFDTELYGAGLTGDNYLDSTISSTNVVNDEPLKIGVTIKSLTKVYNTRKKSVKAIDNIDITLYTGQVTSLLGHNGAGKTTLIKILTGMMRPTAGQIIVNSEITRPNDKACRYLGVCSQSSVLIDTMSAREHLIFYAKLKTTGEYVDILGHVLHMVESLGLGPLVDEPVAHLSEGMRRRLCVAIAFIGQPKLVVLDEPSSGVDPVARRQIWDLVVRHKEGCTVLLTTHYLDEAELLSDRVVVLHKGKVLCSGSPLALKNNYGSGYKLLVTYPSLGKNYEVGEPEVKALTAAVHKWTPNASLTETDACTVTFTVPFLSNTGTANNYEQLALELEQNQTQLGYVTFSMNCATLEQVFLKLCAKADEEEEAETKVTSAINGINDDEQPRNHFVAPSRTSVYSASVDELYNSKENIELIKTGTTLTGSLGSKFFALLKKRTIHYVLDWRVVVCAIVLPTIFTAVAMGFSLIRPPNTTEPALLLTPDLYQPHTTSFISIDTQRLDSFPNQLSQKLLTLSWRNQELEEYNRKSRQCRCEAGMQKCEAPSPPPTSNVLLKLTSSNETIDWLLETHNEYIERRYGGWSLTEQASNMSSLVVWYNNKGYHAMPAYLSTLNNALLQTVAPGATIAAFTHPLKLSLEQLSKSTVAQHIADVGIAMVLLLAFSLVPASGAIYLVQERMSEEKRLQLLCGVSPTLYWSVAFLWDMIVLIVSLLAAIIVFNIFGLPVYVARDNLAAVSLLILLYGWACIPFVHLMQRFFHDASMANMILFCSCAFIGIMELTCLLLMDILGTTQFVEDLRYVLHKIYLIFPQFVLGDGLVEISKNNIQSDILKRFHMDTYVSPLSWELMGLHYLCLFIVGIVLFTINLVIENNVLRKPKQKSVCYPSDTCCLETINLCKEYNTVSGKMSAVKNLSLQVPFGQCLGLIGVNGAGKSTTFKMLTTEIAPSKGHMFLLGKPIGNKPLFTGEMGYCPQCDALDPKLTVLQTIKFYLTLRGIPNQYEYAHKLLSQFELMTYANRRCENLSGGNKRKLCTALSILGHTSLVLMDEPTSGMDPYSRSLVANTIQQMTKQNRSVVLTSHSVEDCENLCSHVIVMINGRIACQGSPHDLKQRFGSGYIVSVRLAKPSDQDALLEQIQIHFPGAQLMSRQYCSSQFSLSTEHTLVSQMFSRMAKISECIAVEDFNLVQCSLDQVFINFTNKSQETESTNIKSTLPDMYTMTVL